MSTSTDTVRLDYGQLRARFDVGGSASANELEQAIASAVEMVRFQIGIHRSAKLLFGIEDEVARRLASGIAPDPEAAWLKQHATSFGLPDQDVVDILILAAPRWTLEPSARVRSALAEEIFFSREAELENRVGRVAEYDSRDWRISALSYHNPLELVWDGATLATAAAAITWLLNTVSQVQKALVNSKDLQLKSREINRLDALVDETKWKASRARSEAETAEADAQRAASIAREEALSLESRIAFEARRVASQSQISDASMLDRNRAAVLRRLDVETGEEAPAYEAIVQATVNVEMRASVAINTPVIVNEGAVLARLPQVISVEEGNAPS